MCREEEDEYCEVFCTFCGSVNVSLTEEYEELGIRYMEYRCQDCEEEFMEEESEEF